MHPASASGLCPSAVLRPLPRGGAAATGGGPTPGKVGGPCAPVLQRSVSLERLLGVLGGPRPLALPARPLPVLEDPGGAAVPWTPAASVAMAILSMLS